MERRKRFIKLLLKDTTQSVVAIALCYVVVFVLKALFKFAITIISPNFLVALVGISATIFVACYYIKSIWDESGE